MKQGIELALPCSEGHILSQLLRAAIEGSHVLEQGSPDETEYDTQKPRVVVVSRRCRRRFRGVDAKEE